MNGKTFRTPEPDLTGFEKPVRSEPAAPSAPVSSDLTTLAPAPTTGPALPALAAMDDAPMAAPPQLPFPPTDPYAQELARRMGMTGETPPCDAAAPFAPAEALGPAAVPGLRHIDTLTLKNQ